MLLARADLCGINSSATGDGGIEGCGSVCHHAEGSALFGGCGWGYAGENWSGEEEKVGSLHCVKGRQGLVG